VTVTVEKAEMDQATGEVMCTVGAVASSVKLTNA
jgi:hypothetical protein